MPSRAEEATGQPVVDLVDDTFIACAPERAAAIVAQPARWSRWWPQLRLTTTRDRGVKGQQWAVQGALVGTAEVWLEPFWDGVVLHFYLRASPPRPSANPSDADRLRSLHAQGWKRQVHALKDELERGREPGEPSVVGGGSSS